MIFPDNSKPNPSFQTPTLGKTIKRSVFAGLVLPFLILILGFFSFVPPVDFLLRFVFAFPLYNAKEIIGVNLLGCSGSFLCFDHPSIEGLIYLSIYTILSALIFSIFFRRSSKKLPRWYLYIIAICVFLSPVYLYTWMFSDHLSADPKRCGAVFDGRDYPARSMCYKYVGEKTKNPSFCEMAKNTSYTEARDNCYNRVAFLLNDLSMCGKIFNEKIKSSCKSYITTSETTRE